MLLLRVVRLDLAFFDLASDLAFDLAFDLAYFDPASCYG
jgi:hypothetical protein